MFQDAGSLDVSGAVVQPAYRSTPWQGTSSDAAAAAGPRAAARVALVSESGICRGPLAAAAVAAALAKRGLGEQVECECRATQSYCVGEEAHPAAVAVAAELGLQLPEGYAAQQFKEARDIVEFDVVSSVHRPRAQGIQGIQGMTGGQAEGCGSLHLSRKCRVCRRLSLA